LCLPSFCLPALSIFVPSSLLRVGGNP
jgi:hypothetical protein